MAETLEKCYSRVQAVSLLVTMLGILVSLLMAGQDPFTPRDVIFSHTPVATVSSVSVVGGFNNWDRAAFPMSLQQDGKTWKGTFKIAPGVYPYLFVENGNKWVPDPKAPPFPDANGNKNSKVVVEPADYGESPGKPGDGSITRSALRHRPEREDTLRVDVTTARLRLRTRHDDIRTANILSIGGAKFPMRLAASDDLFDTWVGTVRFSQGVATHYVFSLENSQKLRYFSPEGLKPQTDPTKVTTYFAQNFGTYPLPSPPSWIQEAVFYQIFPERFANEDLANDGPNVQPWGTRPTGRNRMGGDLAGIARHIDHLEELGINALYLNPVFKALSNHAYDTVDYETVDPRFGTNQDLIDLVGNLKKRSIRTILDAVFNHSSPEFKAFQDLRQNGKASAYKNWYFVSGFPVEVREGQKNYRTFAGVPTMPKLNQDDPACRQYFLGIGERWIKEAGIAGWRLDVADEVSQDFWRAFRNVVRTADPDAYILGEAWGDAHEFLQGDQHDAVMNYRWREAVLNFLAYGKTKPSEFAKDLQRIRDDYPNASLYAMFNLLGSHDTERLKTVFKGDIVREKLAIVFQFTYPGVPTIYYGDEIGMGGGRDPDDRRCMEWNKSRWDIGLFEDIKSLIKLRRENPAFQRGAFKLLEANDKTGVVRFERSTGKGRFIVILNSGKGKWSTELPQVPSTRFVGQGAYRKGRLTLEPNGFAIYAAPH